MSLILIFNQHNRNERYSQRISTFGSLNYRLLADDLEFEDLKIGEEGFRQK